MRDIYIKYRIIFHFGLRVSKYADGGSTRCSLLFMSLFSICLNSLLIVISCKLSIPAAKLPMRTETQMATGQIVHFCRDRIIVMI